MWKQRPFEDETKKELDQLVDGDTFWSRYTHTRDDIAQNVLQWVAAQVPGLSDHGIRHISNVIDNVGQVLGITSKGLVYGGAPILLVEPFERLLLLMGALLHDIGNIRGRNGHNLVMTEVWRNSGHLSFERWDPADRRTIAALCRAHTGKAADGTDDTLKALTASPQYFLGDPVPLAKLAATLRFADELAEGSQRTSRFLLFQGLYGVENVDFHRYANSTQVTIDRANGRIALNYDIELTDPGFGEGANLRRNLRNLLELIFKRVLKLEKERVYARHYAPDWLAFSETSVLITIERDHKAMCDLQPLVLNDFNLRHDDGAWLSRVDSAYDVDRILGETLSGSAGEVR